jgi:hypothetical protein
VISPVTINEEHLWPVGRFSRVAEWLQISRAVRIRLTRKTRGLTGKNKLRRPFDTVTDGLQWQPSQVIAQVFRVTHWYPLLKPRPGDVVFVGVVSPSVWMEDGDWIAVAASASYNGRNAIGTVSGSLKGSNSESPDGHS